MAQPADYCPDPDLMESFGMSGDLIVAEAAQQGYMADRDIAGLVTRAYAVSPFTAMRSVIIMSISDGPVSLAFELERVKGIEPSS